MTLGEVGLEQPARDELVRGRLGQQRRRQIGLHGERFDARDQLGRADQVADAQARRGDLRERERVDDALALGELVDARLPLALVADERVRVVLDDQHAPSRASSARRWRRSSVSVRPLGFWKVGIV